jgi:hypothetical protein
MPSPTIFGTPDGHSLGETIGTARASGNSGNFHVGQLAFQAKAKMVRHVLSSWNKSAKCYRIGPLLQQLFDLNRDEIEFSPMNTLIDAECEQLLVGILAVWVALSLESG